MPDPATLWLFVGACAGLVAVPGPAVLYIISRSAMYGRRAGLVSVAGIETGNFLQVLAATAGLAAIVASSATLFSIVKYAGAAYLVYLGIRTIRDGAVQPAAASASASARAGGTRLYWEGVVVGALNPKLALFLLAFLPQFIDPGEPAWLQTLVLGTTFSVIAMIGDGLYALAAGAAGSRLRGRLARGGALSWAGGGLLIGLGAWAAAAEGRTAR
jgi:threonine/homoserine/homoserine lactone efflux protein